MCVPPWPMALGGRNMAIRCHSVAAAPAEVPQEFAESARRLRANGISGCCVKKKAFLNAGNSLRAENFIYQQVDRSRFVPLLARKPFDLSDKDNQPLAFVMIFSFKVLPGRRRCSPRCVSGTMLFISGHIRPAAAAIAACTPGSSVAIEGPVR